MPSLQSSVMSFMLAAATVLQVTSGTPLPPAPGGSCTPSKAVNLPASSLPGTKLALQYVAIGRGVQNYTCASTTAAPLAIGAIATLWDATPLAKINLNLVHTIPGAFVNVPKTASGYALPPPLKNYPTLGEHHFLADGTPTFNLASVNKILFAKKLNGTAAPADAPKGPNGSGAVDWLLLDAKPGYASKGASVVYRVETAGGKAPAICPSLDPISVQYAAEYWFYY